MNKILQGNCLEVLKTLPSRCIQCVVTSPPYFGLRDYGADEQIGLESTPEEYVNKLVEVFREVRRVLRDDGTIWLNLGDSYCSIGHKKSSSGYGTTGLAGGKAQENYPLRRENNGPGLKHKDLIGIPWRVAFALQEDGWYLRQDIIWHKPNPMPESVKDRCTKSHEYVFLLTKSANYFYDSETIKEEATSGPAGSVKNNQPRKMNSTPIYQSNRGGRTQEPVKQGAMGIPSDGKRNKRSVWSVNTKPYKEAHFATMPPELAETCILAGSREGDTVLDPFGGAGTTAYVAQKFSRQYISIELNQEYIRLQEQRIKQTVLL